VLQILSCWELVKKVMCIFGKNVKTHPMTGKYNFTALHPILVIFFYSPLVMLLCCKKKILKLLLY